MCNVTTLAMQLGTMAGSDRAARDATCKVIEAHGGKVTDEERMHKRLPDLLLARFQLWTATDWKKVAKDRKPPFDAARYKGWDEWGAHEGTAFHKSGVCLGFVFLEVEKHLGLDVEIVLDESKLGEGNEGKSQNHDGLVLTSKAYYDQVLAPELEAGATVMLSTKLTSGHIVMLVDVLSDGVIINDPFGARLKKKYLANGTKAKEAKKRVEDEDEGASVRFRENPTPLQWARTADAEEVNQMLGDNNFFTWAEVETWQIGIWNGIATHKAADEDEAEDA